MNPSLPASIKGMVTLIVLCAMLPVMGLIIYSGFSGFDRGMEALGRDALRSARVIMAEQEQAMENARILLFTLARLEKVRERNTRDSTALFQNIVRQTPAFANIRLLNRKGETLVSAVADKAALPKQTLKEFKNIMPVTGFTVRALPLDYDTGTPQLGCFYPVLENGKLGSVLMISLKLGLSKTEIPALETRHIDRLHIVDKKGTVLLSVPGTDYQENLATAGIDEVWTHLQSSPEQGGYFFSANGRPFVFERLRHYEKNEPELTLILTLSSGQLHEQMQERLKQDLLLMGAALAIALAITMHFCNVTLLSPLKTLLKAANAIKEGAPSIKTVSPGMPKELRLLASSIDSMAETLASRDRELMEARDAADSANKTKMDFLANMSHEIRTPMNAILGMTYLTRQEELTEQQRSYLDNIHDEADKLLLIINDILDFSKIEAGKFHIEHVPFAPRPLLNDIISTASTEASRKGLHFSASLPAVLPQAIKGDPVHFKQVLVNLVTSAVKVTDKGEIRMVCRSIPQAPPKLEFEFRLIDKGGFMKVEELARLFPVELSEDDSAAISLEDGFVLNLAVTRKLVRLMQGALHISKAPPEGGENDILLRLPFIEASLTEEQASFDSGKEELKGEAPSETSLKNLRILLVEDNAVNQQIAEEILKGFGAMVYTASNGLEALTFLETMPPDQSCHLVLMDLQMPEMGGLEATRRIRKDPRFAGLPIIAMTAQAHDEEWLQCAEAGMNDFTAKPINVPALLATVLKYAPQEVKSG